MASTFSSLGQAITTGTIIAIVIGSVSGLIILIGTIIIIVVIVKKTNRRRAMITQGMVLQPTPAYGYPAAFNQQYAPNMTGFANYPNQYGINPPPYATAGPLY